MQIELRAFSACFGSSGLAYVSILPPPIVLETIAARSSSGFTCSSLAANSSCSPFSIVEPWSSAATTCRLPTCRQMESIR